MEVGRPTEKRWRSGWLGEGLGDWKVEMFYQISIYLFSLFIVTTSFSWGYKSQINNNGPKGPE